MFKRKGFLVWPVGTGDSITFIVRESEVIFQVDLHHTEQSEDDATDFAPIVDRLIDNLPVVDGRPYLSTFVLTHPDKDHIQGFIRLLSEVTIGELWFTPRVFREQNKGLCDDAVKFREEAHRRVAETIKVGSDPGPGNRVRLIGYDPLLEEDKYQGFPAEFFSVPGNAVTTLDGVDHAGFFRAFIHAPFKPEELVGDRNDTSLVMQILLGDDPSKGGIMLWGDHKYPTMRKIIDVTRAMGNEDNLRWLAMVPAHHCSKSVMYQREDDEWVLMQDILVDLEAFQVGAGRIVASCCSIPDSNQPGDNPPHALAKARYEEIAAGGFLCTHDDGTPGEPLRFEADENGFQYIDESSDEQAEGNKLAAAVSGARGSDAIPAQKVGFGEWD